jgi:tetratricopeptide (TPR) repeat protein
MALTRGDRLGRYEVLGPLGSGGMGEVYRARDTELEREVAVKVLPSPVATDPDRLERFRRETRAVAALSHPNILEIFDVGSDGGLQYAVTELLEGDTLRERLAARGMPWQRVVELGSGIADGLAAAHGKGIVHRDLKPENVFVTSDGRVKVLDFGLARVKEDISSEAETGTLTPAGTQAGTIMGTLGYMAPEQVRGKPADQRSDIFALGCVLYEIVAGRRAFGGDTAPDTMAAILKEDPPQLSATGVLLPAELERIIHRCLEKRPEARFQSAADLAYSLKAIGTGPALPMATPTGEVRPVGARGWRWQVAVAAAVLAVGATVIAWIVLRPGGEAVDETRTASEAETVPWIDEWQVAVESLDNRTGDPSLDPLGQILADRIIDGLGGIRRGLQSLPPITVVAGDAAGQAPIEPDGEHSSRQGRILVTGYEAPRPPGLEVAVQIRDVERRTVLYSSDPFELSRHPTDAEVAPLLEKVMGAVATHVRIGLENVSHVPDYTVLREFLSGLEEEWSDPQGRGLDRIERALEMDPEYLEAATWLAGRGVLLQRKEISAPYLEHMARRSSRLTEYESLTLIMLQASQDGALARALETARGVLRVAPQDHIARFWCAEVAADLGEFQEAVETLSGHVERVPRSFRTLRWLMLRRLVYSYHEIGRWEQSLAEARRIQLETPGETWPITYQASALAALGRLDELEQKIQECERIPGGECNATVVRSEASWHLIAHGHREAGQSYARQAVEQFRAEMGDSGYPSRYSESYLWALRAAELWQDMAEFSRQRMARYEEGSSGYRYALSCLGMATAHLGDTAAAEEMMTQLAADEDFVQAGYVAAHLGQRERAVDLLKRGIAAGRGETYARFTRWDLDLEPLWGYPPFEELLKPKD